MLEEKEEVEKKRGGKGRMGISNEVELA